MLLKKESLEKFKTNTENLGVYSRKKVCVKCDFCHEQYETTYKSYYKTDKSTVNKDCCIKCRHIKVKECNQIRHGVDNVFQLKETKEKTKKTNNEKYGSDWVTQSEEFKEKSKQTNLEKYGSENFMQSEAGKRVYAESIRSKFGVDNISQLPEVKEKSKKTQVEKYGDYYVNTREAKQKIVDKFGVENVFANKEIQEKIKQTNLEKYGVEYAAQNKEVAKRAGEKSLESKINKGTVKTYDNKTLPQVAKEVGFSRSRFFVLVKKHGFDKAIQMQPRESSLEKMVKIWLDTENIPYKQQVKFNRQYCDFVVDNKIALELDGLYWHSEAIKEDKDYHYKKRDVYLESGLHPLFFREDELNEKFDIVKSIILNKLNKSNKIFARKCNHSTIDNKFFEDNHLMGKGRGTIFALENNGEIVSAIQVCCRNKKTREYEVSRFCNKLNTSVIGGFSKLLKKVAHTLLPAQIVTFIDNRYGTGEYLKDLGFEFVNRSVSFRWTNGNISLHRMKFPSNTGYDHKFTKIYDGGQSKYVVYI